MSAFAKGILSNLFSKTAVAVIGLLTVIFVSRHLGAEGRGAIGLFMSVVALIQLVCDFGNSSAIINLSYKHNNKNLWLSSLIWMSIVCILSFPVLFFFRHLPFVWLVPPAAFIYSLINLNHLILMGNQKVHLRNTSLLVMPLLLMLGFVSLTLWKGGNTTHYVIALFIALIISAFVSYKMVRPFLNQKEPYSFEKAILKQGFWAQSAQAVQFFNYRLNFFLLAYYIADTALSNFAIGIYNNAIILSESVWILGHSIAQMQHMKILNTESREENFKLNNRLINLNYFGTFVLMLALILIPESFWGLLFSGDFVYIRQLFYVTAIGVLAFGISNIINHALHAASRFKEILFCNLIGLAAGAYTAVQFMPNYQVLGASFAWSIGLFVSMLSYLLVYLYHHRKFYHRNYLYLQIVISLLTFSVIIIVFRRLNIFEDLHFIQRFSIALCVALSTSVVVNFILSKLMYGIKPHNS